MQVNAIPEYDMSDNPTHCCPRFNPAGWDGEMLHFNDKAFVRADTKSLLHIPVNMSSVFAKTFDAIESAGATARDGFIVLSFDRSPWAAEHYFAVSKDVPGQKMEYMTGDFLTKVFEGPYKQAPKWEKEMQAFVREKDRRAEKIYFFYTTCPKCAKYYGKNYLVAVAELF